LGELNRDRFVGVLIFPFSFNFDFFGGELGSCFVDE
jgi:hypothetical protein